MAVANRLSVHITQRDAAPRALNPSAAAGGMMRGFVGKVLTVATDDINSVYRFAQVPSSAVMHTLRLYSADIGSSAAAADIGLYSTTEDGAAVVDQDFFASAVNLNAGALNGTDVLYEADSAFPVSKSEQRIWEALGLSTDPRIMYDVCLTATGAIDAAVSIALKGTYAI